MFKRFNLQSSQNNNTHHNTVHSHTHTQHTQSGLVVSDPDLIRRVFDKNQRNYKKDTDLAYSSFLDLLGNGIITSYGDKWKAKRNLLGNAFRVDILEETAVGWCGCVVFE